jgi:hypothetical protein
MRVDRISGLIRIILFFKKGSGGARKVGQVEQRNTSGKFWMKDSALNSA